MTPSAGHALSYASVDRGGNFDGFTLGVNFILKLQAVLESEFYTLDDTNPL